MSSALSDEALLAGLAAGDADAATAFIRRFQARVYGLVVTIVRDEGVAEDVAQEMFVRAWKHARTYDPRRGRVATWLLTIARNLAIDVIRVKSAQPLDPDQVEDRLQRARVPAAAPPTRRSHLTSASGCAAPSLSYRPNSDAPFLAAYLGRTAKEIGELEGVPLGTAKTRIRAAMLKPRDLLETATT